MKYQVQSGDTLSKIADYLLGDPTRWREIASLNNLTDPNKVYVGQILNVPEIAPLTAAPVSVTAPSIKTSMVSKPGIFAGIDFKKPILGVPLYIWLIGAGALVVVPMFMRKK